MTTPETPTPPARDALDELTRHAPNRKPRAIYPETAVLDAEQVADAIGVSVDTVEKLDLPTIYLGKRTRRYVWGQVLATLRSRAA